MVGEVIAGHPVTLAVDGKLEDLDPTLLFLDTGAASSVIGGVWAERLLADRRPALASQALHTRLGTFTGGLYRCTVTLLAHEGVDLSFEPTVLLTPDWPGPPTLGYPNGLERLRLALEPADGDDEAWLHFGPAV